MITEVDAPRDLSRLAVPLRGSLEATGDLFEPYRLVDANGAVLVPVAVYFRELAACGRPAWDVTREDVDRVVAGLSAQGLAASTRRGYVQAFKGFHAFLVARKASEIEAAFGVRLECPVRQRCSAARPNGRVRGGVRDRRRPGDHPGCRRFRAGDRVDRRRIGQHRGRIGLAPTSRSPLMMTSIRAGGEIAQSGR